MDDRIRCAWATHTDQEAHYHDTEWGRPQRDETTLFEFLVLEGAQAGLSWRTILNKRDGYRAVFDDYDIARIAQYSDADLEARVQDARIVKAEPRGYFEQAALRSARQSQFRPRIVGGEPVTQTGTYDIVFTLESR